jgi:predicted amino acid dehydrogenase
LSRRHRGCGQHLLYLRAHYGRKNRPSLACRSIGITGRETTAAVIYEDAWEKLNAGPGQKLSGVAGRIASTQAVENLRQLPIKEPIGVWLHRNLDEELGLQAPIRLSEDLSSMTGCNLIITASNTADAILYEQHLGEGPIVICDIAVPPDVSPSIRENRPDVVVTNGGCVRMPDNQDLKLTGIYLPDGHVYACTAETIVLGLAKRKGNYSFGPLDPAEVHEILNLSKDHGFVLGDDVAQSGAQAMKAS